MLVSAICAGTVYAQTPTNQSATANPEVSTATEYKWYTMESTNDGDNARKHLFLLYESSNETPLHTVLLSDGVADGVNLTTGGESIPEKYLWRLDDAGSGNVFLVNKASGLRISVPSSANNTNSTKLEMSVAGAVWSKEIPSGNAANQVTFDYAGYKDENNTHQPAYLNAMLASVGYGVTIYKAGQNQSSGWYFYPAYTETVEATTYCAPDMKVNSNKSHQTRHVTAITVTGGTAGFSGNGYSSATDRPVYEAHLDQVIVCRPGDVLTPVIAHDPEDWVHKYVYVDWDDNKVFDVVTGTPGQKNWGELVSYTYIETSFNSGNGYNSEGTSVDSQAQNAKLGSFTVPDTMASGDYRIRFKVDWNSTDPCGNMSQDNYIADNGGAVIDLTLRVDNRAKAPEFSPASGTGLTLGAQQQITITSDAGATIYYTTDGTDPVPGTSSSIQSGETVSVTAGSYSDVITVKAVAQTDGKDLSDIASATYTVLYPYCDLDGLTETRTDRTQNEGNDNRHVDAISVTGSSVEDFSGSGYGDAAHRPIYEKHLDQVIVCCPGDVLQPSVTYDGEWMHKYVYVDWGKDGVFDVETGIAGEATGWGDLVSYNYIGNKTSAGEETTNQGLKKLGSFTVPADASGDYVIRFKIDWDDTDPCVGSDRYTSIANNGGAVIDLTLRVENKTAAPVFSPASCEFPVGTTQEITITSSTEGATIYYTLDGTEPTDASQTIENGGTVSVPVDDWRVITTVKAFASAAGKDPSNVTSAVYTVESPYCDLDGLTQNHSSENRYVTNIRISDASGTEFFVGNGYSQERNRPIYEKHLDQVIACSPGDVLKPAIGYEGHHMHKYVYVDWGKDGVFDVETGTAGQKDWGDLVSYSYIGGKTSDGSDSDINNIDEPLGSFEIPADASGDYVIRFKIAWDDTDPCGNDAIATDGGAVIDLTLRVNGTEPPVPTEDKEVTADTRETGDAAYRTVTVKAGSDARMPVWTVGENTVSAQSLDIEIAADATTPEIALSGSGTIEASTIRVVRAITADVWALMALPFDFDLADVTVNGAAAQYGSNIRIMEYDGGKRADGSVEGYTMSGWTEKTSGTIAANVGFALVVNPANGAEQSVIFSATSFLMDANDKEIGLTRHPSSVNINADGKSGDADWNLRGNPMLQKATKGTGYSLYIYDAATDSYNEHASTDTPAYVPFAAWFVQSDDGFTSMSFSHVSASAGAADGRNIDGRFAVAINGGEDEARITVAGGSSQSYVRNEDAMYFAPNSRKVSQLYLIDEDGAKIASSVVPEPYAEVRLAYDAVTAGEQTLTVTSLIPGTAVTLVDNETGKAMQMGEGSEYTFTSAAGLDSDRFVLKTSKVDLSGIETAGAEASGISAVAAGGTITVYGAEAGSVISVYTVNGAMVSSTVAADVETVLPVSVDGVLLVKAGEEVIKVVK